MREQYGVGHSTNNKVVCHIITTYVFELTRCASHSGMTTIFPLQLSALISESITGSESQGL